MTMAPYKELAVTSLREPREAARWILNMNLPDGERWQIAVLASALTAAITGLSFLVVPPQMPVPLFFSNPLMMAVFVFVTMLGVARVSAAVAPMMGGAGDWRDMLILLAWVQGLRVVAQALLIVLSLVPAGAALGAMLGLMASLLFVWISAVFTAEALRLSSAWKGLAILALAGLAVVLGLAIVWAILGPVPEGIPDV